MSVLKGDFLGFTFDGIHSSTLGIFRVSDGSRYTENLLPTMQDKTTQIPGADGMFYHGSFYTQRAINFPIAFDSLTEQQLRRLKTLFGDKKIHTLSFDELPFKEYKVKVTGTPNLKYVCFNNEEGRTPSTDLYSQNLRAPSQRLYKGEGQLSFTAYNPYAKSRYKYEDKYTVQNFPEWNMSDFWEGSNIYNYDEWKDSARLLPSDYQEQHGNTTYVLDTPTSKGCLVYNPGDFETPFKLKFWFEGNGLNSNSTFSISSIGTETIVFEMKKFQGLFEGDAGFQINSKLNLIEGIDKSGKPTGTLYNKFLIGGDFFKIKPTFEVKSNGDVKWRPALLSYKWENATLSNTQIEYDYLYF